MSNFKERLQEAFGMRITKLDLARQEQACEERRKKEDKEERAQKEKAPYIVLERLDIRGLLEEVRSEVWHAGRVKSLPPNPHLSDFYGGPPLFRFPGYALVFTYKTVEAISHSDGQGGRVAGGNMICNDTIMISIRTDGEYRLVVDYSGFYVPEIPQANINNPIDVHADNAREQLRERLFSICEAQVKNCMLPTDLAEEGKREISKYRW